MLRILGSPKRFCDGLMCRDMLWAGGLGLFGLGLADCLRRSNAQAEESPRTKHFGKAKACILLYLYGAPSQLETFDMKPDCPRGNPRRAETDPLHAARAATFANCCPARLASWTRSRSCAR